MEDIKPVFNSSLQRSKFIRPLGEDVRVFLADEVWNNGRLAMSMWFFSVYQLVVSFVFMSILFGMI